jgi:hypothetical protein
MSGDDAVEALIDVVGGGLEVVSHRISWLRAARLRVRDVWRRRGRRE